MQTPLYIATNPRLVDDLKNQHIKILEDVVLETFWDLLSHAKVLILSLKDVKVSAGHMVLLQALKYGNPILVNDIPSIRDYVSEAHVVFYKSGDIDDMYAKMKLLTMKCFSNANYYKENYTFDKFLMRLIPLLDSESIVYDKSE